MQSSVVESHVYLTERKHNVVTAEDLLVSEVDLCCVVCACLCVDLFVNIPVHSYPV